MLIPRQLAPSVGPAQSSVEFLEGLRDLSSGIEELAIDQIYKKKRHGTTGEDNPVGNNLGQSYQIHRFMIKNQG